jgi:hypothetical protein
MLKGLTRTNSPLMKRTILIRAIVIVAILFLFELYPIIVLQGLPTPHSTQNGKRFTAALG